MRTKRKALPIREAAFHGGEAAQVEEVVTACEIQYRPRRLGGDHR